VLRRAAAFVIFALALAAATVSLRAPTPTSTTIVVAARDLGAGHRLEAGDLQPAAIDARLSVPAVDSPGSLLGRRLATAVTAGEPLSPTRLVPRTLAEGLPPDTAAFPIRVADPRVLDLLSAGQHVRLHRASTGALLATHVLVLGIDPATDGGAPLSLGPGPERGIVVALPASAVDAALATPENDGLAPRMQVVPDAEQTPAPHP